MLPRVLVLLVISTAASVAVSAEEIQVAAAANFSGALEALAVDFEAATGHDLQLVFGSTGKHYAQIRNGAPFDLFLAADVERPELLERDGLAVPGSRFTYATGCLVLWSPREEYVDPAGEVLKHRGFRYLAIANPKLAPYGRAAHEVLASRGLWEQLSGRLVRGESIAQTYQFIASGNAELGFVALSQVKRPGEPSVVGSFWRVPPSLHQPIEQQAVLLVDKPAGRAFLDFIRSHHGRAIIRQHGYTTPD